MASKKNYYKTLGVERSATTHDIKRAFRKLALTWHPDKHQAAQKEAARRRFILIVEAYEILSNDDRRKEYDAYFSQSSVSKTHHTKKPQQHEKYSDNLKSWQRESRAKAKVYTQKSYKHFANAFDTITGLAITGAGYTKDVVTGKGKYRRAIKACKEDAKQKPDDYEAYYGLGFLYFKKGEYEEAVKCYRKALKIRPHDPDIYYSLGKVREKCEAFKQAANCFKKTVELNPHDAQAYYSLGIACSYIRSFADVRDCILNLKKLHRTDLARLLEDLES